MKEKEKAERGNGANRKRKVSKTSVNLLTHHTAKPKYDQNKLYDLFSCNHRKKTHALIEAPGHPNTNHWLFHIQSFHSQKLFSDAEFSTFLSPLKPFWFVTSLSSKQTTHQPTTNHYFSHVGCCNLGQFVTPHQTKAQQKQGWWWWNLLAQTQWGRLHFFIKVSKVIYGDVQQETTLKMGEGKSSPLWLLEEADFTHTHTNNTAASLYLVSEEELEG